ncbi:30S ribosome-binding factor RbfA [Stutzerimonas xanthomarina]|uniref:30S ribosome-binding factor RbfA n=1 Tax=Stutzerimonas xanthomarina TaxID=271420 RepID=UPI003AA9266A
MLLKADFMAKEFSRTQRIGDQMQRELAQLIQREVKDPRLGLITITAVGSVAICPMPRSSLRSWARDDDEDAVKGNLRILNDASGFLRMQLGKAMKLRTVPQLHFNYDASVRRGGQLTSLIERAVAEDRKHSDDLGE